MDKALERDRRVAVLTGGHGGIGRAIAARLERSGTKVIVFDVAAPQSADAKRRTYLVDVADEQAVSECVAAVLADEGRIDILVNNAGVLGPVVPVAELSLEHWNWTMRTNLTGTFVCSKLIAPFMVKAGWGRIVNISSLQGKEGTELAGAYAVSKAGQIALAKVMAKELARTGVTVNCITPTVVDTGLIDNIDETRKADLLQRIPMRRFGQPAEVAEMVAFVVSDACSYTTGATFDVSGGRATW